MKKIVSEENNVFILAEIAQSYEGNEEVLLEIIQGLYKAKSDGVMFQVVLAHELAVSDYEYYDLFKSLEMTDETWSKAVKLIQSNGMMAIGEVFGKKSFDMMMDLGIDGIKIHVSDINNEPFLRYVGDTSIPVLLAIGGATSKEIENAINLLNLNKKQITLMHGYQDGPTKIIDTHFNKIRAIAEKYDLLVGYSDHISGSIAADNKYLNPMAIPFPLVAIGAGATLIEKHVILDREMVCEDFESALSVAEFSEFVSIIRQIDPALGNITTERNETELAYRRAIKTVVAKSDLKSGDIICMDNISFKRPKTTNDPIKNPEILIGRELKFDVKANEAITLNLLV